MESANHKVIMNTLKNISLNLVVLPNEYLHMLLAGVKTELQAWEQRPLSLISEYQVNNEQMFTKKTEAHRAQLAAALVEACRIVSELHIL